MQILKTIHKVPGGLMVVPLFIGMLLNTFAPDAMKIGGFTQALTNVGYPTMLGVYLFTVGTKMTLNAAPQMLKRGFGIMFAKVGVAILVALGIAHFFDGDLLGLSTLAVLAAMNDTNGGMFMALTSTFGSKEDAGTYVPQSIETGPFLTMLVLVGAGLAVIPWLTMVSVIAPIAAGAVLGNLDKDIREFFEQHEPLVIPFMAFMLGQGINLQSVTKAGLPGIVLGLSVLVITGFVCILADKLLGGSGVRRCGCVQHRRQCSWNPASCGFGRPQLFSDGTYCHFASGSISDRDRRADAFAHSLRPPKNKAPRPRITKVSCR